MSDRIEKLLTELTLDEKVAMVAGTDLWHTAPVERLGIPALKVTDGPIGARGERWTGGHSAAFPCGTALGATWDPDLVREVGARIGVETRRRHAHVLLAPTVNVHRHPLAGRNFECYSEDPHLSARLAVAYIEGVQLQGVGACVKHVVANDSEFERMSISSEVDDRTLRELLLPPFEAAVREAGVWSIMTAYNRLNGTFCAEHPWLLRTLLREEWEFDGAVMSDWFGTHSTVESATAGLDLEMPGPAQWYGARLAAAVQEGAIAESVVDERVRNVLGLLERTGALDDPAHATSAEEYVDDPDDRAVARRAAAASFVLLRNTDGALPIEPDAATRIAVIGPNADVAHILGGGSARVPHHPAVTPLAGLRARFGNDAVVHERGCVNHKQTPALDTRFTAGPMRIEYYAGKDLAGEPLLVEQSDRGTFTWLGGPGAGVPNDFSARVTATFVATEDGPWTLSLVQAGRARLRFDGERLVDNWDPEGRSDAFFGFGSEEAAGVVELVAGEPHTITVEFVPAAPGLGGLTIGCLQPAPPDMLARAVAAARDADAVVCVVGTDGEWEGEGNDRTSMALPGAQDDLVRAVAAVNARTVVVVNAASPIAMPWADDVAAVLYAWFPGEEWGNALADVLSGDESPSGKLPTTFPARIEDTPAFTSYPGERGVVRYGEGVFMGYRWYDARAIDPAFCFGHGLSYSTFELGQPEWDGSTMRVTVTNSGPRRGAEVVQCYVRDVEASVARPPQELAAFGKVALEPGEAREVILPLRERAFSFWDPARSEWVEEPGEYELRVGFSSRDIRHTRRVERA